MCFVLYWYYQEERGTSMAYAKAIELNSDDIEYLQSLVRTRNISILLLNVDLTVFLPLTAPSKK